MSNNISKQILIFVVQLTHTDTFMSWFHLISINS